MRNFLPLQTWTIQTVYDDILLTLRGTTIPEDGSHTLFCQFELSSIIRVIRFSPRVVTPYQTAKRRITNTAVGDGAGTVFYIP